MSNFKSISFKMAVLQGAGRICPPHVCVIQKTPCGRGLNDKSWKNYQCGQIAGILLKTLALMKIL